MNETVVRSTRIRVKPLNYWNNERINYTMDGDVSFINASTSTLKSLSHSSILVPIHVNDLSNSEEYKGLERTICKTRNPKSVFSTSVTNKKRPKTNTTLKPADCKDAKKPSKKLRRPPALPHPPPAPPPAPPSAHPPALPQAPSSAPPADPSSSPPSHENQQGRQKRSKVALNSILSEYGQKRGEPPSKALPAIAEGDEDKDGDTPLNIDFADTTDKGDVCVFRLESMVEVRSDRGETVFLERGPFRPSEGLFTGFVFLPSPTLHWGALTHPRELFVIDGCGEVELVETIEGRCHSLPLRKGKTVQINPGGDVTIRKGKCILLKLFVVITSGPDEN